MRFKTVKADGLSVFYRECGSDDKPVLLLLHGFPSASHMFRDLMPMLEKDFHLIAPDYPGFGQSDSPARERFDYTFDHLAEVMDEFLDVVHAERFYMYVFDYGAPIGFRIAVKHPERILTPRQSLLLCQINKTVCLHSSAKIKENIELATGFCQFS